MLTQELIHTHIHTNIPPTRTAALSVINPNWKQLGCPSMGKQTVVYLYYGMLLSNKKE